MIYLNLIKCLFVLIAFGVLVASLLVNFFASYLPAICVQTFKYGKYSTDNKKWYIKYLEIPKSWFKHFYFVATIYSFVIISLLVNAYIFSKPVPRILLHFLDLVTIPERVTTINATVTFLAITLFCLQIWKRLYETTLISVYSDGKINIIHYLVGIFHYLAALTAIISEAPEFAAPSFKYKIIISLSDIGLREVVGIFVFFWAWYNQYRAAVILANLRKDGTGNVVSYNHKIPVGGLFDRLSSPHMFCEMLMYLALNLILWGHSVWPYVFLWVFCNQCEMALLNHWWYKSTFKAYPKKRKAFLPFIL